MDAAEILLVDDEPKNLKLLFALLQEKGFKTRVASSGKAALEIVSRVPPDLILLDVMMPGMSGLDLCRQLKSDSATADIPVIFMTALDDVGDKVRGFSAGGVDYITKPFDQFELLARLNTHLRLRNRERELQRALAQINTLTGILPICSLCKRIRNDKGYWQQVELYISEHSDALFSHSLCVDCFEKEMKSIEDDD